MDLKIASSLKKLIAIPYFPHCDSHLKKFNTKSVHKSHLLFFEKKTADYRPENTVLKILVVIAFLSIKLNFNIETQESKQSNNLWTSMICVYSNIPNKNIRASCPLSLRCHGQRLGLRQSCILYLHATVIFEEIYT